MKLSDYVIDFLAQRGIRYNFLISGGAVIHLVDSVARHSEMKYICGQHEEHSAAAADMYARVSQNFGVVMTTSGPGATNIVTSVCNAFFDSVPLLCITGQVSRFRIKKSKKLRQRGFQETDVVSIFQSITKYVKQILDPLEIRYELEKALYLAKEGRPGPVLLDIPDDLQREEINPETLRSFLQPSIIEKNISDEIWTELFALIEQAKRPVIIFGVGIQQAAVTQEALEFAEFFKIPVVTTWGGLDIIAHDHELNMGCIGVCGPRGGNFAVQASDLVIALGTRLSQMVTGGKQEYFATRAKKVMVDVDEEELNKFDTSTFTIDLPICADLRKFFKCCKTRCKPIVDSTLSWRKLIISWKNKYSIAPEEIHLKRIQPYFFIKRISSLAKEGDIIIGDTGANLSWLMQSFETKPNQRVFSAWNHTPMGYSLPASIGAALASNKEIICLIGDGGFMMCLQELATIRRHNLPVRIFIFDNQGHGIQKQTIDTWLHSNYAGVNVETGLYFPRYQKIAEGFDIPFFELKNNQDLNHLMDIWVQKAPWICNVEIVEDHKIVPMLKFGSGLEDLDPKLSRDEISAIFQNSLSIRENLNSSKS